ncbi:MAG: hypothetical protein M3Q12_14490 [Pseudomonadota bacterium]|uniref:hypothetical protein n=1 Tax=Polaromonas sp. TaxID=1869339 RepID=UPI0017906A4C|nr:hypothetical protein [Polaromonas sp.]MBA3593874.1 hypothetical protein [Polaromonas sp.]MDQ3273352.1 hypothetical protein [Pseudomonadota bacterium]
MKPVSTTGPGPHHRKSPHRLAAVLQALKRQTSPTALERELRVSQSISLEEFDELSDMQLDRLLPKAHREVFPGKHNCADRIFI